MLSRGLSRFKPKTVDAPPVPLRPDGVEDKWILTHINGNLWGLTLKGGGLTQTGSSFATTYTVPFYHSIVEIRIKHTDSAGVDATTGQSINLKFNYAGLAITEYNIVNTNTTDILLDYHQAPKTLPGGAQYVFTTNAAAGELIKINITLTVMKG